MTFIPPADAGTVAEIGMGTVGASWAALMLAKGMRVHAHDPAEGAEARARALIESAWASLVTLKLTGSDTPPLAHMTFFPSIAEAVAAADIVQENTPEAMSAKGRVLREISAAASPGVPVLSSTGGILPSDLQAHCAHPERFVVFHPFNPTHLIPLIEVVPGKATSAETVAWAMAFAAFLGKTPICLKAELAGHMTNRLQFALVREAVRCIVEGVASASDIDAAVRHGLAPRWMLTGGLQTLHLAGGFGGMQAILDHAGPAIEDWWHPGAELRLTDDVKSALVEAGAELSDDRDIADWMTWRDAELVALLRVQRLAEASQPTSNSRQDVHS